MTEQWEKIAELRAEVQLKRLAFLDEQSYVC